MPREAVRHTRTSDSRDAAALQRHVHELLQSRRSAWRRAACSKRRGSASALAPNGCCGRPLISQGLLAEARALRGAEHRRCCIRSPSADGRSCSSSRAACRPCAKMRPTLLRGESPARRRQRVARPAVLFEELARAAAHGRTARRLRPGPATILLHGHCHQKAMGCSRRQRRCCRAFPARRSSTSMPAAAAWPDRSATCAITTTCRARSASGGCCRPRARWTPASVLVASGVSCRHQVEDFTGARALHPPSCSTSLLSEPQ